MLRNSDKPIHLNLDSVRFSVLTSDDIRKLSVTRVITANVLDNLGHPLRGGLYDLTMGPMSENADPCGTCFQNIFTCSGHFGHIELPLPTVNPLFHKLIPVLLRVTCLNCYAIQLPELFKTILIVQLKLLNCGLITEADEIEKRMLSLLAKHASLEQIPADAEFSVDYYEKLIEKCTSEGKINPTKNSELLLGETLNNTFKEVKSRKACMYCKAPMFTRIQCLRNRILMVTNQVATRGSSSGVLERKANTKNVTPEESRQYLRKIWQVEKDLLLEVIPLLKDVKIEYPTDVFFFDVIPVTPPSMRPVAIVGDVVREGIQNVTYKNIINSSVIVRMILGVSKNKESLSKLSTEAKAMYNATRGETAIEKLNYAWEELQRHVDTLLDSDLRMVMNERMQGLKQLIEKKTGIIRLHMMGKRVNFAGRSVITPDPNLNIDEIGVPEAFAKQLVYAVPVTHWNVEELRKLIRNGPDVHPGAVMIKNEDGKIIKINPKDKIQQESLAKRLLTPGERKQGFRGLKVVYRHMCNGDIMLVNRQPTLHKPSIMAHTARILKGEKTLRLHYANCKGYNADFDGDEMNVHFPQGELARSEGYFIANVCNQYLVPKDGTPLSGLIQDYVIAGSKLSMRGRFFTKMDYQHFVFQGLTHQTTPIKLLPPAILKPVPLWSGKQIISTIILNVIPEGKAPFNLTATSKIPARAWQAHKPRPWHAGGAPFTNPNAMTEAEVIVRQGELLSGILDKTHYGSTPFGLVHCTYELYGGVVATKLLNAVGKLFLNFLKTEGFTLGVHDILIRARPDRKRKRIVEESRKVGKEAVTKALELPPDSADEEIVRKIEENVHKNPKIRAMIDREYKSLMDGYTNEINKTCLPAGLICKFPYNNLQFMVQSGAKGSTVNTMQISCLLGQIELEGKRPPVMISGKSLPSFPAFEFSPRAGGFIDGRFMTGIQPQEFFFHCMAGREGLIDTAVKTSRSGYLQRCLIKHLEGLTVNYDLTVRDSDKNVIQFSYGDDGMDVTKAQFLRKKQMDFLADNCKVIIDKKTIKQLKQVEDYEKLEEHVNKIAEWREQNGTSLKHRRQSAFTKFSEIVRDKLSTLSNAHKTHKETGREKMAIRIANLWRQTDDAVKKQLEEETKRCPDTPYSLFQPDVYFGSLSDRLVEMLQEFGGKQAEKKQRKQFEDMLKLKAMKSLCCPGEPVGMLAAQSVGEPSTQMTLNTFHFAGRGEMNVTLGIPRLREILMEASRFIKTPSMEVPFLNVANLPAEAEKLKKLLTRVVVANVLEKIEVMSRLEIAPHRQQRYTMRFHFLPHKCYKSQYCVKPKRILKHMNKKFFGEMFNAIRKIANAESKMILMEGEKRKTTRKRKNAEDDDDEPSQDTPEPSTEPNENNDDNDSSDEEPEDTEDAKLATKYQEKHDAGEPDDEEKEQSDGDEEQKKEAEVVDENETGVADDAAEVKEMQDAVLHTYKAADGYCYDTKHHLWCELSFAIPLTMKKIDMSNVLKDVAKKSVIWETPHIRRAITYEKNGQLTLRTDGINFHEMFKYNELLDLNKLYSNDIHKIAETYGIEAATRVIVKEVQDVFAVYGITVDQRHLSLIADYMTCSGAFVPLNRSGMDTSVSAIQQMSFESSLAFLRSAVIRGKQDLLQNPSSCLMVGKPCKGGTGSFDLLYKLPIK